MWSLRWAELWCSSCHVFVHTLHTPLTLGYLTLLFLPLQFQSLFPNPLFFFRSTQTASQLCSSFYWRGIIIFLFLGVLLLLFSLSREDHRHYLVWLSPQCTAYNSTKSVNKKIFDFSHWGEPAVLSCFIWKGKHYCLEVQFLLACCIGSQFLPTLLDPITTRA